MAPEIVSRLIDGLSYAALAVTFFMLSSHRLRDIVHLLTVQAVLLTGISAAVAFVSGITHVYVAAAITLLVKGLMIPAVLLYILKKIVVTPKVESFFSMRATLIVSLMLVIISFYVAGPDLIAESPLTANGLPISISLVLIGLFMMISRKKALMQVIGLITMENGLYLMTVSATYGMPLMVEIGMFFDLLVGVIIMGILAYRINRTFDTINTEKLNNLKG